MTNHYSQFGEDIILEHIFNGKNRGFFLDYFKVYGWLQGKPGSNAWYLRDEEDYNIVKERYRG